MQQQCTTRCHYSFFFFTLWSKYERDTVHWLWSLLKDVFFLREVDKANLILYLNTALDIGVHLQQWILKNLKEKLLSIANNKLFSKFTSQITVSQLFFGYANIMGSFSILFLFPQLKVLYQKSQCAEKFDFSTLNFTSKTPVKIGFLERNTPV